MLKPRPRTSGGFTQPAKSEPKARQPLLKTNIAEELTIDDLHLNEELMGQPTLMRKYTQELAKLKKSAKSINMQLELKEAEKTTLFSKDGTGRKVSEVEAAVISDPEVQRLKGEVIEAERMQDEYEGIVKSIHQRFEMLKELCANTRKEMV